MCEENCFLQVLMKDFRFNLLVLLNPQYCTTLPLPHVHIRLVTTKLVLFEAQNLGERSSWPHISPVVGEEPLFNSLCVGTDARLSPKIDKKNG